MNQDQTTSPTPPPDSASETGPIQPEAELQEAQLAAEQDIQSIIESLQSWFANAVDTLLSASTLWQALAILAAVGLGWVISRRPSHYMKAKRDSRDGTDILYRIYNALAGVMWPICIVVLLWVAMFAFRNTDQPAGILRIAASLTNAAIIVRLLTQIEHRRFQSHHRA
jgi:hypothetical protein